MKKLALALVTVFALGTVIAAHVARAEDESTTNKVKDAAGDAKTDIKKGARTAARKGRKATGNDNVVNDVKDKANDAGDSISNSADKAKRKTEKQD